MSNPRLRLRRRVRERVPEGVLVESLSWRDRWLLYAAYPTRAVRYLGLRFRKWATLPGDTWMDFQRDAYYVVTAVKPRHIEAEVYSGQVWTRPELMAEAATAPRIPVGSLWELTMDGYRGVVVEVARIDREEMAGWLDA